MEESDLVSKKTSIGKKKTSSKQEDTKKKELNDFIKYEIDGFTVLVGKNNHQNDELTTKVAKPNDLWFHVKDLQGSHVILVTNSNEPSQEIINRCASITAFHSKAKQSSNVPVDYAFAKYVKKPSKSKPGMVIYTNQKTVNVQPKHI